MHDQLAERTQHEKREEAAECINENQSRTGLCETPAGTQKETRADGAADGNHLNLARLQGFMVTEILFGEDLTFGGCRFSRMHGFILPIKRL